MSVNDKLLKTRFVVDPGKQHITVNTETCTQCPEGPCLVACPAQCFQREQNKLTFSWESCVECGTCRIVCPNSAVSWEYPRGGFGVCFRFG